ncbi:MAG: hypothetical protein ACI9G5_002964 [Paracoccaceae bacterium]|jgi:hypothetical protein
MNVENWNPSAPSTESSIDLEFLQRCLAMVQAGQLEQIAERISADDQHTQAPLLRVPQEQWTLILDKFSNENLNQLLMFFVRAEMLLPGWEAEDHSPAIWINKLLKARGERLSKDQLLWIRANTNNHYIPNGRI